MGRYIHKYKCPRGVPTRVPFRFEYAARNNTITIMYSRVCFRTEKLIYIYIKKRFSRGTYYYSYFTVGLRYFRRDILLLFVGNTLKL